ncbi:hypothetical protein HF086_017801 [Spodoptera exigua]|uniref:Uncharacterized protein n=1 Tax=Spodoptera exigua TaxID=7107 RepID=A0A922MI22_SPOEX|nr:hypothetical protein HF086_017801 [Spodoptera exigua]
MVKKVVGRGRSRKVAHDQLRRTLQPGDQVAVSAGEDSDTPQNNITAAPDPVPSTSQADQQVQKPHDDENISSD